LPNASYEELAELVGALRAHVAVQDAQTADLKRQVAANSRNSSKPRPPTGWQVGTEVVAQEDGP